MLDKANLAALLRRWRLAAALCAGSAAGGIMLDLLHAAPEAAMPVATGVAMGVFLGLNARHS